MLFRGCLAEGPTISYLRTGQAVSNWIFFALTWRRLDKAVCAWGWVSCTHWEKGSGVLSIAVHAHPFLPSGKIPPLTTKTKRRRRDESLAQHGPRRAAVRPWTRQL